MPPVETLPPFIDIPVNFQAALAVIQWSRQIVIGGFSLYQWAWSFAMLYLSTMFLRYFISNLKALAGVPDAPYLSSGDVEDLNFGDDGAGYAPGSSASRRSASNEIYGEDRY